MRYFPIALLVLASAACDLTGPGESDASDAILFISNRSGDEDRYDIFRTDPDGTGAENLTRAPALKYGSMDVSPDGEWVVFEGHPLPPPESFHDIYVMRTDGSDRVRLTGADPQVDLINEFPHWSPDGTMIAFATTRDLRYGWSVYVMNADGSGQRNVAASLDELGCGCWRGSIPIGWTPDGRVVFEHLDDDGVTTTYAVSPDGSGLELVFGPDDNQPAWSPDGSRVVFSRKTADGASLHVMSADGSGVQRLTAHDGRDVLPGGRTWNTQGRSWPDPWSPDGSRIAFEHLSDDGVRIYVINADGTGLLEITDGPVQRDLAANWGALFNGWSPDGDRIAFTQWEGGTAQLYVIGADGTGLTRISTSGADEGYARWVAAN